MEEKVYSDQEVDFLINSKDPNFLQALKIGYLEMFERKKFRRLLHFLDKGYSLQYCFSKISIEAKADGQIGCGYCRNEKKCVIRPIVKQKNMAKAGCPCFGHFTQNSPEYDKWAVEKFFVKHIKF